jgi:hypothetical protein
MSKSSIDKIHALHCIAGFVQRYFLGVFKETAEILPLQKLNYNQSE